MEHLYKLIDMADDQLRTLSREDDALANADCAKYADVLAHLEKDLLACVAMKESQENEGGYGSYREGGSYSRGYGEGGYQRSGYGARGRGRNARRNAMGQYAAGAEDYVRKLEKLMDEAPNDQMREVIQRALDEAQRM